MYVVNGYCTKCGAPIYSPNVWHSITPPPSYHSCNCFSSVSTYTSTNTKPCVFNININIENIKEDQNINELLKEVTKRLQEYVDNNQSIT